MGNRSPKAIVPTIPNSNSLDGNAFPVSEKKNGDVNRQRVLLLHGWRTSGDILWKQTAAFRYHTGIEVVKVNAPWPAKGPPDSGIAEFYPNEPYYQWWDYVYEGEEDKSYDGHTESISKMEAFLDEHGPFAGILGFSQGATVATMLVELQMKRRKNWFNFVILICGVPPLPQYFQSTLLNFPSLHLIGNGDTLKPMSEKLVELFHPEVQRTIYFEEGHNIPSIRTNTYPDIKQWIRTQIQLSQS